MELMRTIHYYPLTRQDGLGIGVVGSNHHYQENTMKADVPLTYSVPQAGRMLEPPLSKNAAYAAAKRGQIPTLRFGHLLRVPGKKWRRMLAGDDGDVIAQTEVA
jgi:hypothetical protein